MIAFLRLVIWALIVFIVGWFAADHGMRLLASWGIVPEIADVIRVGLIVFCLFMASGIKLTPLFSWVASLFRRKNSRSGYGGRSSRRKSSWFTSWRNAVKEKMKGIRSKAKAAEKEPSASKPSSTSTSSTPKGGDSMKKITTLGMKFMSWVLGYIVKYPLPALLLFSSAMTIYSLLDGYIDPQDWVWIILTVITAMTILKWWGPAAMILWSVARFVWGTTLGKWLYLIFSAFLATFLWSMFAEKGEMAANLLWGAMLAFPLLAVWFFVKAVK